MYHKEKIAIYGLFDSKGVCLYVGQSVNPHKRWLRLTRYGEKRKGKLLVLPGAKLKVLQWVSMAESNEAEKATIASYKAKGEAVHNLAVRGAVHLMNGTPLAVEGFELPFESLSSAARTLGVCTMVIHKAIRKHGGRLLCWKPKRGYRKVSYV